MTKHEQILKHIESLAIGSKFQLENRQRFSCF